MTRPSRAIRVPLGVPLPDLADVAVRSEDAGGNGWVCPSTTPATLVPVLQEMS